MTREQIIQILEEDAREFDSHARMATAFPKIAAKRRRHAEALREAVELIKEAKP